VKKTIEEFLNERCGVIDAYTPYQDDFLADFLRLGSLHAFIPRSQGGKMTCSESYLSIVETASYHSVPLGLTLGISGTLFLQPMARHAAPAVRDPVIGEFLQSPSLGGMMITEPAGGTDIFGLDTHYAPRGDQLILQGTKCWGGLTGKAAHWLVGARLKRDDRLTRRLGLLYVPLASPGVDVQRYFDALGLQPIPYGQTRFQQTPVPAAHLLGAGGQSGLRLLYDTLFRSRLGMPAIAAGLCRRLADEAVARTALRSTFGRRQDSYDQVRYRLSELRGMGRINGDLWRFTGEWMDEHADVSGDYTLVNAAKVVSSETMQAAADSAVQIFASAAYKRDHLVGRAFVDSRPFQIFEGSNDVLHENTCETIAGRHGRCDRAALEDELQVYGLPFPDDLPQPALDLLAGAAELSQRQKVQLGQIIAWIFIRALQHRKPAAGDIAHAEAELVAQRRIAELTAGMAYLG